MLEVAPSAEAGAGHGTRRRHPVGRRREDLHRVAAPEAIAVGALDDLHDGPFTGHGMADEHDPRLRLGQPGDAMTAVSHRPDLDLEPLADA